MKAIPSFSDLYSGITDDFKNKFGISTTEDIKAVINALSDVQAGTMKLLYLFMAEVQKNLFPDTADSEANGGTLERIGRIRIGRDPFPAEQGEYTIDITGSAGGTVEAGRQYISTAESENPGKLYEVKSTVTLVGLTGQVEVRALEGGTDAGLIVGDKLELTVPLPNIDSEALVNSIDTAPVDAETTEEYRQAVLLSFKLTPQGGAAADYRIWANDVSGVRSVYPYAKAGTTGYIEVYVEATRSASTDGEGTPPASMILDLWDNSGSPITGVFELNPDTSLALEERGRRPLSAWNLDVQAITLVDVDVEIENLEDDSAAQKAIINSTIIDFLYDVRPFIDAADDPDQRNDTLYRSLLASAISDALGPQNRFDNITVTIASVEYNAYTFEFGQCPKIGTVTYV